MDPLAEVDDLAERIGQTLTGPDQARAEAALEDASALVRAEARRDWENEPVPAAIVTVTLAVARRIFTNPDNAVTRTAGPFTESLDRSTAGSYLTEQELAVVRRYRPATGGGLWTQPVTRGERWNNTVWIDDQFGLEPFPIGVADEYGRETWPPL